MSAGGSPMHVMTRDEVIAMWSERQSYLEDLLKGLVKNKPQTLDSLEHPGP